MRARLFPLGVKPPAELTERVKRHLRARGIDRFAVALGVGPALLDKVAYGIPCNAAACAHLADVLDAYEVERG